MVDANFWRNRKVFITGHTGFKGTWLSLWLHFLGASVTGYALPPPKKPSLYELCGLDETVDSYIADIRDRERLCSAIRESAPDLIFHMAAQPLVKASYVQTMETFEINMMGTVHLLEAVREAARAGVPIRAVIVVTSDKCYDNQDQPSRPHRETDRLGGEDPYSASKACAEIITSSYRSFLPVPIASARAGNVIGGGDWAKDRLVPDTVRALLAGEPVIIRSPKAVRPWQHVLEPLHGYLLLGQKLTEEGAAFSQGWNFGPEDGDVSVEEVAAKLCGLWGGGASYRIEKGNQGQEAIALRLDCEKAKRHLGWFPRWNIEKALTETVEWVKAYSRNMDVRAVCLQQITEYMKGASGRDD